MVKLGILSLDHPHSRGNHIPALRYLGKKLQVAAICHPDEAFARPWAEQFGARWYATRDELLADPDITAVLVTSKNDCHAQDCIAAARAGKDILCDKPIAISPESAAAIRDAVEQAGVRFVTTVPVRFNTTVRAVKRLIDEGKLGRIKAVMATNHGCMYEPGAPEWVKHTASNGGGCIVDHTVHVADIIRWYTGSEFATVQAMAEHALHDDIDGEDVGVLQGTLQDGTVYQIDTTWSRMGRDPMWGDVTFRIVGTEGTVSMDIYNNQRIDFYTQGKLETLYANNIVREHGEVFCDYCDAVDRGLPSINAGVVDGLRGVELVYAGYESLQTGAPVTVKHR